MQKYKVIDEINKYTLKILFFSILCDEECGVFAYKNYF